MDKATDTSIHFTAEKITEEIQNTKVYNSFYSDVQKMTSSPAVQKSDFKASLTEVLKRAGKENELKNTVFHWVRQNTSHQFRTNGYPSKEPLAYLRKAQLAWEKRIHKSFNTMTNELRVPLARFRVRADKECIEEKWYELGQYEVDLSQYRPVYGPKDFLEVLLWIRSPNYRSIDGDRAWDLTQLPLRVKSMPQLRSFYAEISRGDTMVGMDPDLQSMAAGYPTLETERTTLGGKVLAENHSPVAQEFLKRGCPRALRGQIWALTLGCRRCAANTEHYENLKQLVLQYDLLVDKLIIKDVQQTASNDDQFFVFEDVLYQVLLCFSRDSEVLSVLNCSSANPIHAVLKNRTATIENTVIFPPSGVIPFHGFTMFAAPFCYLYDEPVDIYHNFRAFYTRHLFRLHEVSSHEEGLLRLCLLYERLIQKHEPQLWAHLTHLEIKPIQPVFKWVMRAFSGHLPPEQVLQVWDLVLAFDSLVVIPLLAASIVSLRRDNLLLVDSAPAIEAVLADLSSVRVLPLLQFALLRE